MFSTMKNEESRLLKPAFIKSDDKPILLKTTSSPVLQFP